MSKPLIASDDLFKEVGYSYCNRTGNCMTYSGDSSFGSNIGSTVIRIYNDGSIDAYIKLNREYNAPIDINPILARAIYTYIQELGIF